MRPFKPATEPRDLNPTDKTRANHIVDRVLALDPETAASQLADVSRISRVATATCWRSSRRAPTRWKTPLPPCDFHQEPAPAGRRLFSARIFLRSGGPVQSEHRRPSRSVRRAGRRATLHPQPARCRGRACLLPDISIGIHRGRRQRDRRSDSSSCLNSQSAQADIGSGWRRCRGDLQAGRGHQRAGDLSHHRIAVERHRGCPLRGVRRWRAKNILRDLYRLQRQGDQVRVDRDHRLHVLPDVAAEGNRRAEQGHGAVPAKDRRQVRHDRPAGQ